MSLTWYRGTDRFESGDSGYMSITAPNNGGLIVQPTTYNDILYGTKDNPAYRVYASRAIAGGTTWRYYPIQKGYIDGNTLIRIVGVIDGTPLNVTNYETDDTLINTKISGKWRVKDNVVSVDGNTAQFSIPVINTVTLKNGSRYANSVIGNPYRSGPYGGGCSLTFGNIQIGYMSYTQDVVDDLYKDMVVDFGDIGQDVPKFVLDYMETNFNRIYTNTYTIKSSTGETLAEASEQPPIIKTNLINAVNSYQLALTRADDRVITLTWENQATEGKVFKGLSVDPNSTEVVIPVGETDTHIENSANFYMVYEERTPMPIPPPLPERPLSRTFDIYLYQNRAEVNRVGKSPDWLDEVGVMHGALRDECSVVAPVITFMSTVVPNFNYVHIPIFGRYYFVLGIESISTGMWRMRLNCDVLETYKNQIWDLTAVIDRQENDYNPLLNDPDIPAQLNKEIEVLPVNSTDDVLGGGTFDVQSLPDVTHRCEFVLLTVGEGETQ